ncbi:MAG: flagellar motor protein MotB [Pseudomonadota bacterium]
MSENARPIIKRKKVVAGDGHHGGAWKVAYADFVTAMMAFFLLMWLLNATTESQRKGIADYFAPTIPVSPISGGGDGVVQGDSVFAKDTLAKDGTGGASDLKVEEDGEELSARVGAGREIDEEDTDLDAIAEELAAQNADGEVDDPLLSHIATRVTDEGLVIEVFAREGEPLFESGSPTPTPRMLEILAMIADVASLVTNRIAVEGHTDARPFASDERDNWSLSASRADASRRAMLASGLAPARISRISGRAAEEPAVPENPEDPRNRRVAITLLRNGSR